LGLARLGIGVDRVDLAAATARGIAVINTPDGPTESTAEHAIALMLGLAKNVGIADRRLHQGDPFQVRLVIPTGLELMGATLGLVGLGRIGRRVAEIARVLGMRVIGIDPLLTPPQAAALGVELVPDLPTLLAQSDVVSLHAPAIAATYRLINADTLALMKPGAYLVNVARGELVDETALLAALDHGHLAGAALDVFDPEPPDPTNALLTHPHVIVTPHIASQTAASVRRIQLMAVEQLVMLLRGERPPHLVNPEVWEHRRSLRDRVTA
jgi:D-3-phosphoglycerate dehydrogenase / 2-oxoglutarate reductase